MQYYTQIAYFLMRYRLPQARKQWQRRLKVKDLRCVALSREAHNLQRWLDRENQQLTRTLLVHTAILKLPKPSPKVGTFAGQGEAYHRLKRLLQSSDQLFYQLQIARHHELWLHQPPHELRYEALRRLRRFFSHLSST